MRIKRKGIKGIEFWLIKVFILVMVSVLSLPINVLSSERNVYIEAKIIDFIKNYYAKKDGFYITLNNLPSILSEDGIKIKNIAFSRLPDIYGNGICTVEVLDKRNLKRNVFVPFKVMEKRSIFFLKEDMKKGDILTEDKVVKKEIFLSETKNDYPTDIDEILGKMIKRDASANTVITKGILEDNFVIKRNDIVSIVVDNRKITVKAKGRAIDRGRIGDVIRVKNLTSQREILGRVTSSGVVHVDM